MMPLLRLAGSGPARVCVAALGCALTLFSGAADAEEARPRAGATSPRALVESFLEQTDERDYAAAARLIEPSRRSEAELARLARRLRVILDQHGPVELDLVSSSSDGELEDKLPADRERLAAPGGDPEGPGSLTMVRVDGEQGPHWLISRATVARVDGWYRALPGRWLVERLPPMFSRQGPAGLQLWQWLALGCAIVLSAAGAFAFGRLTALLLRILARRTKTRWDDLALLRLRGPFVFAWLLVLFRLLLPLTAIPDAPLRVVGQGLRVGFTLVMFWGAVALVEAVRLTLSRDAAEHAGTRALLGLGGRLLKTVLVLIAIVAVIADLGFSVTSLVAGIGVGGLGLALAAQKTVENVFGAFSLGVDQPFSEGDLVTVDGVTGTVERIGLRSTRIRTLERTLVAIPNGRLAEMRTETLTARDRFRLRAMLALRPGTPVQTVRAICTQAEALLRAHPAVGGDAQARVVGISPTSIDVEVLASFLTTNVATWSGIREEMLLGLLEVVTRAGTTLSPGPQAIELVKGAVSAEPSPEAPVERPAG